MQLYCSFVELKLALNSINPNPILNRTCFIPLDPDLPRQIQLYTQIFFFHQDPCIIALAITLIMLWEVSIIFCVFEFLLQVCSFPVAFLCIQTRQVHILSEKYTFLPCDVTEVHV